MSPDDCAHAAFQGQVKEIVAESQREAEALKRAAEEQMKERDGAAKGAVRSLERAAASLQSQLAAEVERAERLERDAAAAGTATKEEFSKSQAQLQAEVGCMYVWAGGYCTAA